MSGQYELALADLQKAIELDPKHPNAYEETWPGSWRPARKRGTATARLGRGARQAGFGIGWTEKRAWSDVLAAAHAEAGHYGGHRGEEKAIAAEANRPDVSDTNSGWNCTAKVGRFAVSRQVAQLRTSNNAPFSFCRHCNG